MLSKGRNVTLSEKIRRIKFLIRVSGASGKKFAELCVEFGLENSYLRLFVAKDCYRDNYVFMGPIDWNLKTFEDESILNLYFYYKNSCINSYSFPCNDEASEDQSSSSLLSAAGASETNGLTHAEITKIGKLSYNQVDRLVQSGVLTKSWAAPKTHDRTTGVCTVIHLTALTNNAMDGVLQNFEYLFENIRNVVLKFLRGFLWKNELLSICCQNVCDSLIIGKRQMQYLRNLVVGCEKQNIPTPVLFCQKKSSALTKAGNIGSVRIMWCLVRPTINPQQAKFLRARNVSHFQQIDLEIRNNEGISSKNIRMISGLNQKRSFKTSQELLNQYSYSSVKIQENKTIHYKILPRTGISGKYLIQRLPEVDSVNEIDKKETFSDSQSAEDQSTIVGETEKLVIGYLRQSRHGVLSFPQVTQMVQEYHRAKNSTAIEGQTLEQLRKRFEQSHVVDIVSAQSNSNLSELVLLLGLRNFLKESLDVRIQKYSYDLNLQITSQKVDADAPSLELILSKKKRRTVRNTDKGIFPEETTCLQPTPFEHSSSSICTNQDVSMLPHTTALDDKKNERGKNEIWLEEESIDLLVSFICNFFVRKAKLGLPNYLKPSSSNRKSFKSSVVFRLQESVMDFQFKWVDFRVVRNFYILNATEKVPGHSYSSCRHRVTRLVRNILSASHLIANIMQRSLFRNYFPLKADLHLYNEVISEVRGKEDYDTIKIRVLKFLNYNYPVFYPEIFMDQVLVKSVLKEFYLHSLIQSVNLDFKGLECDVMNDNLFQTAFRFSPSYQKSLIERTHGIIFYTACFDSLSSSQVKFSRFSFDDNQSFEFHLLTFRLVELMTSIIDSSRNESFGMAVSYLHPNLYLMDENYQLSDLNELVSEVYRSTTDKRIDLLDAMIVKMKFCFTSSNFHHRIRSVLTENSLEVKEDSVSAPWRLDGLFDASCFSIFSSHVLTFLAEYPGVTIEQIHRALMILPIVTVGVLLEDLLSLRLVKYSTCEISPRLNDPFEADGIWQGESQKNSNPPKYFELRLLG